MASFTDQIPQFNPYIQQLPVEAMVKVGMEKQQRYDMGLQKIQSQIEQVAGLDILRPIDKEYLSSKMDELGSNLKSFAASDFSNFQLVNSVGGMVNQLSKDKNIQNAVSSTAWYRKQQRLIEEAKKEGKSNIANEDLFFTQVNSWINDTNPGVSFSAEYVPYTDVFKKLQEIAKSVGEDSTIVQQLFETDANGNPKVVDGKLRYNDVMAETLLKGKDKNKILTAFQNGLDSNDYRQLSITGRYELKGKSREELVRNLDDNFLEYQKIQLLQKDSLQDKILELKTKGGSQKEIDALKETVLRIDSNIKKRKESLDKLKTSDLDAMRGSIYTNNYIDSMAATFSEKDSYTKYSKNPAVEMMLDRERLKLQQNQFKLEQDKFRYQQNHDAQKMAQERWKALFEKGLVDEYGRPTGAGLYSGAARDLPIKDQTNPLYFSDQFEQGLRDDTDAQFKLYEKVAIADWMAKNSNKINPNTGKIFTSDEIKQQIGIFAKKTGNSYNDYIVLQGQKATDRYNQTKGKSLGSEYAEDFRAINELGNRIGVNTMKMRNAADYVAVNAQGFKPFDFKKVDVKPMEFEMNVPTKVERGKESGYVKTKLKLSKEDLYNFALISPDISGTSLDQPFTSQVAKENAKNAMTSLVRKFGSAVAVNAIAREVNTPKRSLLGLVPFSGVPLKGESSNPFVKLVSDDNFKKTMILREEYFKNISQVGVPKGISLYKDKAETREHLKTAIANVASDYSDIDDSYQELVAAVSDDKSQFQINIDPASSRYGKNTYNLQVTKPDGSIILKPITESHFQFITGKQAPSLFIDDVMSNIKASPYKSTNLAHMYTDEDAYSTAFIKDYQTRTKDYNVAIDFVMGSGGALFPKLYVQMNDNNWKLVPYNAGLTSEEAKNFPSNVDDVFIKSLLQSK